VVGAAPAGDIVQVFADGVPVADALAGVGVLGWIRDRRARAGCAYEYEKTASVAVY
jgi:hypothetical protein